MRLTSVKQGKRKRSRPSTATSTPVKDGSSDVSGPTKNPEETKETGAEDEASTQPPAATDACEPKPTEEPNTTDVNSSTPVATPPAVVKEKPTTKTSKDRSDRKREKRKERKASESGSLAMPPASERASPVCNGTAADDMNVCK